MIYTKKVAPFAVSAFAALSALTWASPSDALEPPRTARSVQIGGGYRYGLSLDDPFLDPWRTGLGVELGYTTPDALYLGVAFDYFFGESREAFGTRFRANLWQLAAEGGYDLQLTEWMLLRPKVGIGMATATLECPDCIGAGTESALAAAPGLTTMFFPGKLILSVDLRYQMVFADPERLNALIFSFGLGF